MNQGHLGARVAVKSQEGAGRLETEHCLSESPLSISFCIYKTDSVMLLVCGCSGWRWRPSYLGRLEKQGPREQGSRGRGTEHSLDSRCVDKLHGLVDLEEGLETWRGTKEKTREGC